MAILNEGSTVGGKKIANIEDVLNHAEIGVADGEVHGLRIAGDKLEYYNGSEWKIASGGIPVGNVVRLSSTAEVGRKIELKWEDPEDRLLDGNIIAEWQGTKVIRKKGSYPSDSSDGDLIEVNTQRDKYKDAPFVDEDLEDGSHYYYMLFPYTEDAETIDGANRTKSVAMEKLEREAPSNISVETSYGLATVKSDSGSVVSLDRTNWYDSPHTFLELEGTYTPYSKYLEDEFYYESPIRTGGLFQVDIGFKDESGSPGAPFSLAGEDGVYFFGEVSSRELISGDDLALSIGLSQGTSQFSNGGWLKFIYEGKVQFVAKKPFRYGVSWNDINEADAIYGGRIVVIDGREYKIRLMRGTQQDPSGGDSGEVNHYSEWNRLMIPIHEESINRSWLHKGNVESDSPSWKINLGNGQGGLYSNHSLITSANSGDGSMTWCQESRGWLDYHMVRGYSGIAFSDSTDPASSTFSRGWRPVLELTT